MANITHLQTNFTAGEISPKLYGRVDVARYQNGAKKLRDTLPQVHGGARRRPGTVFVRECRDSNEYSRLIPFIYNESTAYIIEFSADYLRFFKDGAVLGAPYELSTGTNTEAERREMDYTQGADTMFWFHESKPVRNLVRLGDTSWTFGNVVFLNVPYEEPGTNPASTFTPAAPGVVGGTVACTSGSSVFVAGHVGSYIKANGGIGKIVVFASGTSITVQVIKVFASTSAAPADSWSLHAPAWSLSRGYPRSGAFHEQRLVMGGSPAFPQTIWGSATGAHLDMGQGTDDDAPFGFTFASEQVSPIQYIAGGGSLLAFASGGEYTITGGVEKALAPTNAQIRQRTNFGCARVRPVRVGDSELFVQRAGRKVRAFAGTPGVEDYSASDQSILAEHLTEGGIVDMAWQQEPDSIVWMVRGDGVLVSMTTDKEQNVIAWAAHEGLGGFVESIATIPGAAGDEVWLVVRRTVDGVEKRYIERMTEDVRSNCAKVYSGAPATVFTGLSHLEGLTVDVVGDGAYIGQFVVDGGEIEIPEAKSEVEVGLPFTSRIELLDPEFQTQTGSTSGSAMRTSEVTIRVFETTGGACNGDDLVFRQFGEEALGEAPVPFTGLYKLDNLGWADGESELIFTQDKPMPFHLLSVTRRLTANS